mgnify:FL=1
MILILTQSFPSRIGGIESLMFNLSLGLSKKKKVIIFADSHNILYDAIFDNQYKNKILTKRIGGIKFFRRRKKIRSIKLFIQSKKVKLVIGDSWKSLELGIDYLNENKIPSICLAHGNELLSNKQYKKNRIIKTLNKVNSIVANSYFTSNLVKELIKSDTKLNVIHPGATDIRNLKHIKVPNIDGNPVLLTLARLEKRKGHALIIKSIKKLQIKYPNIKYIIAGSGPELKNLKDIVKSESLENSIIFVGSINDYQKKYLFEKTNLMVMPTIDETHNQSIEGFGIAYLEAAFFSIPSIASNLGGTSEAVIDSVTGKIINNMEDLYSSILELLNDQKKILELGKNAQNRVINEFNWEHITEKYLLLINNIILESN